MASPGPARYEGAFKMTPIPAAPDPLELAVADLIDRHRLLVPRASILVAVSGGPDSVALLGVLAGLAARADRRYRLVVAHLDHMIRAESRQDAEFVAQLAEFLRLECVVQRMDVRAHAKRLHRGLEFTGRLLRYRFLAQQAQRLGCRYVATGHHADDNVETILYRIVRGTHLRGLEGIALSRPLGPGQALLVRPLLQASRREIIEYCRRVGLNWRQDVTNTDTRYRRNFIRHELLPLLRDQLNPRVDEALLRLAGTAQRSETYIAAHAGQLLEEARVQIAPQQVVLDWSVLASAHPLVRSHAIRAAMEEADLPMVDFTGEHMAQLNAMAASPAETSTNLPGGFVARCKDGQIVIARPETPPQALEPVTLLCPGHTPLGDGRWITCGLEIADASHPAQARNLPPGTELIDADRTRGPLVARSRVAGDRFEPLGAPGSSSVSDFLTNLKLPAEQRHRVVCILDDLGIIYLAPLRIDQRVRLHDGTRRVLRLSLTDQPAGDGADSE